MILMMTEEKARAVENEIRLQEAHEEEMVPSEDESDVESIFEREMHLID